MEDKAVYEAVGWRGEKFGDIFMYMDSFDGNSEGVIRKVDWLRGRRRGEHGCDG